MDHCTRANGRTKRQMEKGGLSIQMVTSTKALGKMTKHMEKEFIDIWMEQYTKVIGMTISSMAKERKHGQISQSTMEIM